METAYVLKIFTLSLVAGGATFIGVFIGRKTQGRNGVAFGASFAAGMMVCISLLELIPSAADKLPLFTTILYVLLGALFIWLANQALPHIHSISRADSGRAKNVVRLSYLLAVGLILHDFPEGFAIPGAFQHATDLGWLVIIASFVHNVPEGYVLTAASSDSRQPASLFYKSALFSTISTVAGAAFGLWLLSYFESFNPIFMAVAGGAMLYISWHELIPFIKTHCQGWTVYRGFIFAVGLYALLKMAFGL